VLALIGSYELLMYLVRHAVGGRAGGLRVRRDARGARPSANRGYVTPRLARVGQSAEAA
jgi:hypothetical protein